MEKLSSIRDAILKKNYDFVENFFDGYVFYAEDLLDGLSEKDYKKYEPHWSAVQTGDQINTPVFILHKIFDYLKLKDGSKFVDLGSGHGHPGLVFSILNKTLKVSGYELVTEKVMVANKCSKDLGLNDLIFIEKDLSDEAFQIPDADYYYLFNPFNAEVAEKIARQLSEKAKKKSFSVLSLGGRDLKFLKKHGFKKTGGMEEFNFEVLKLKHNTLSFEL